MDRFYKEILVGPALAAFDCAIYMTSNTRDTNDIKCLVCYRKSEEILAPIIVFREIFRSSNKFERGLIALGEPKAYGMSPC